MSQLFDDHTAPSMGPDIPVPGAARAAPPRPAGHATSTRSTGSMRERRPGVWEIRFAVGRDPVTGTPRQRSFTVHGTRAEVQDHRDRLATEMSGARLPSARYLTIAELLPALLGADQPWKPSTVVGYRSVVRFLLTDPLAQTRAAGLTPQHGACRDRPVAG